MKLLITGGSGFIGLNIIEYYLRLGVDILNIDIQKPRITSHLPYWHNCDIRDRDSLSKVINEYKPTHILNLAARTDMYGKTINDYDSNTKGTKNLIELISEMDFEKVIITSSQFVCRPGKVPEFDEDYEPHTLYGLSKVVSECVVRSSSLNRWIIIRPTNIWGPWHPRYPYEFWAILAKGLYIQPSGRSPIRSYGYVKNIIYQIDYLLKSPLEKVQGKTYYVGESSIELIEWVNAFSLALSGREARIVPRSFVKGLALVGDLFNAMNINFPIQTQRFRSMTEDYLIPESQLVNNIKLPYSLNEGVKETVNWMYEMGFIHKVYV